MIDLNKLAKEIVAELAQELTEQLEKGGSGSGNFGHAGRPGEVGGSAEEHEAAAKENKRTANYYRRIGFPDDAKEFDAKAKQHETVAGELRAKAGHTYDGKYLHFPDGGLTSFPSTNDSDRISFDNNKGDTLNVAKKPDGSVYGSANKWDKSWKNPQEFVSWLNTDKEGKQFHYVGIDNIY
jgi:hypothetical protein